MAKAGKSKSGLRLAKVAEPITLEVVPIANDVSFPISFNFEVLKTDVNERTVEGIATAEVLDYQGDVITMDCAIDAFQKFEKAGAVREMHQPRAVGKLLNWWPVQSQKAIGVKAYISKSRDGDDVLVKLQEQILRGFSIGARATDWAYSQFKSLDGAQQTARLIKKMFITELSLVDVPANPKALITVVKVDDPTGPADAPQRILDPQNTNEALPVSAAGDPKTVVVDIHGAQPISPPSGTSAGGPVSMDTMPAGKLDGITKAEAVALVERMLAEERARSDAAELAKVDADEKAKLEAQLSARGTKVGIGRKDGEPLTPPKDYPTDPGDYADPANWSWPCKPEGRAHSAVSYYNGGNGKEKYSDREWSLLGRRIARMAGATLGIKYRYDAQDKRIVNPETEGDKKMEKGDLPSTLASAMGMIDAACKDLGSPDAAGLLEQASAAIQASKDVASRLVSGSSDDSSSSPSSSPSGSSASSSSGSSASSPSGSSASASSPSASAKSGSPSGPSISSPSASGSDANGGSVSPQSLNLAAKPNSSDASSASSALSAASSALSEAASAVSSASSALSSSPSSESSPAPVKKEADDMDENKAQELVNKAVAEALAKKDAEPATTPAPTASDVPPVAAPLFHKQADPLDSPLVKAILAGDEAKVAELATQPGTKSEAMPLGVLDEMALMEATDVATRYEISKAGANASRLTRWQSDYGNGAALPGGTDLHNLQTMLAAGQPISGEIQKSLTAAMNFVGINLERPARLMLPYIAALRRRLAADNMATGSTQVQWRVQLGFGGWDFSAFGTPLSPVAGNTGTDLAGNAQTFAADYRTQAIHGEVQFEAIPFAQGFDDPVQIETARGLATLLRIEELLVLGANEVAIAAPASVTLTQSTLALPATFAIGGGAWTISVTALTLAGTQNTNSVQGTGNNPANQIVGESAPVTQTITIAGAAAAFIDVYWPAVQGAVGYKVYCDHVVAGGAAEYLVPLANMRYGHMTAGAFDLGTFGDQIVALNPAQTYVGVNHVQIATPPAVSTSVIPTGGDLTVNALTYEGLISWCSKNIILGQNLNGLTGYTKIAIDQGGAPLTTISAGIKEFDTILQNLIVQWHVGSTLIVCSPQSLAAVSSRLLAANGGFVYRVDISQERNSFVGGLYAGGYPNKFVTNMVTGQPAVIPIWAHPYMPDGTFLFLNERIPYAYSREARGFALDIATPYTYFELGRTNRSFPFSLFFIETMKCYHPFAQAIIQGARVDA